MTTSMNRRLGSNDQAPDSTVGIVCTGCTIHESGRGSIPAVSGYIFLSSKAFRPAPGTILPPTPGIPQSPYPGLNRPGRKTDHSSPRSTEIENAIPVMGLAMLNLLILLLQFS
jgi:hypothetical protein